MITSSGQPIAITGLQANSERSNTVSPTIFLEMDFTELTLTIHRKMDRVCFPDCRFFNNNWPPGKVLRTPASFYAWACLLLNKVVRCSNGFRRPCQWVRWNDVNVVHRLASDAIKVFDKVSC